MCLIITRRLAITRQEDERFNSDSTVERGKGRKRDLRTLEKDSVMGPESVVESKSKSMQN